MNVPVLDANGAAHRVLDAVEDVTDLVRERQRGDRHRAEAETHRVLAAALEADLYALSHELAITAASEALAARRLAGLAEAALELASAETQKRLPRSSSAAVSSPSGPAEALSACGTTRPARCA